MKHNIYLYILVITVVTYLIRVLPLTLIRREIRNRFLRSFFCWNYFCNSSENGRSMCFVRFCYSFCSSKSRP